MKDSSSRKVDLYLHATMLQTIFSKIKLLDELNKKIAFYLDPHLKPYCQAANLIGNRLVLLVANGSVATQLRLQTADLLQKFKQDNLLKEIREIQFKVRPFFTATVISKKKMELLSLKTATMVQDIAETIEDPRLKEVMSRIATRRKSD